MSKTYDLLTNLAACLCVEMEREDAPALCFCGVISGEAATGDLAGCSETGVPCGMAWVRLAGAYPSTVVGQADLDPGNCGKALGLDIEVGVLRCVPTMDEDGNPPHPVDVANSVLLQTDDMMALRRAVACCDAAANVDIVLGTYQPLGPQGFLGGGIWPLAATVY